MAIFSSTIRRARSGFYGWRIVALMLGPRSVGNGVYVFGNTLFVIPLEESLGLSRSLSSLMFAIGGVIGGLSAPVSGMLMDRWGPRRVLIWSVLIGAAGYGLFAGSPNLMVAFIIFLGPISLVMLNIAFNASSGIINNWFNRYKSTAFALMQGGSGLGSLAIITALAFAIDAWGLEAGVAPRGRNHPGGRASHCSRHAGYAGGDGAAPGRRGAGQVGVGPARRPGLAVDRRGVAHAELLDDGGDDHPVRRGDVGAGHPLRAGDGLERADRGGGSVDAHGIGTQPELHPL